MIIVCCKSLDSTCNKISKNSEPNMLEFMAELLLDLLKPLELSRLQTRKELI